MDARFRGHDGSALRLAQSLLEIGDDVFLVLQPDRQADHVRAGANPGLRLLGYLVTMFNKSLAVHTGYERDLRAIYGPDVFAATIPLAKDFKEAVMLRQPASSYKPRSSAAKPTGRGST